LTRAFTVSNHVHGVPNRSQLTGCVFVGLVQFGKSGTKGTQLFDKRGKEYPPQHDHGNQEKSDGGSSTNDD